MKLNYILYFVLILSGLLVVGITLFNDTIQTYSNNGVNLNLQESEEFNNLSVINKINDVYDDINSTRSALLQGDYEESSDNNFFLNIDAMASGVSAFFKSFRLVTAIGSAISKDFNLPPIIDYVITGIIIIALLGVLINAAIRWEANR